MGPPMASFVAVPESLWLPMGLPVAPFVAVPGVCLAPYRATHGSLCGSTWDLPASQWDPQWLPLWQYLESI